MDWKRNVKLHGEELIELPSYQVNHRQVRCVNMWRCLERNILQAGSS